MEDDFHLRITFCHLFLRRRGWEGHVLVLVLFPFISGITEKDQRTVLKFFIAVFKHAAFSCAKIKCLQYQNTVEYQHVLLIIEL